MYVERKGRKRRDDNRGTDWRDGNEEERRTARPGGEDSKEDAERPRQKRMDERRKAERNAEATREPRK